MKIDKTEFSSDWTEKQDQELKDKEECGWDHVCIMCKSFNSNSCENDCISEC